MVNYPNYLGNKKKNAYTYLDISFQERKTNEKIKSKEKENKKKKTNFIVFLFSSLTITTSSLYLILAPLQWKKP